MPTETERQPLTLLLVHAHPDDEVFSTGGLLARADDEGIRTVLVTSTGGENGEIHDPDLDPDEAKPRLAEIREGELRRAAKILGIDEVRMLGYRDSGMRGTPENDDPRAFLNADRDEAIGRVVRILREVRPDVVATYDPGGGYGHPDHITAHEVATAAVAAAADPDHYPDAGPAWATPKFYWFANVREKFQDLAELMRQNGIEPPMEGANYDFDQYLVPASEITAWLDVRSCVPRKLEAMRVHRTQIPADDFFARLPPEAADLLLGSESYIRVHSTVDAPESETDLFTGLR
jgi:N-acetyl-1-D-myo-inositol-2-amino-2-deoxy-alpha-D-glucopyranoside deacetylase